VTLMFLLTQVHDFLFHKEPNIIKVNKNGKLMGYEGLEKQV